MDSKTHRNLPGAPATWNYLVKRLRGKEMKLLCGFLRGLQSDLTRMTYLYSVKRFVASYDGTLLDVTPDALRMWATNAGPKMKRLTIKATMISLRAFFNHVCQVNPSHRHPFEGLRIYLPCVRDAEAAAVANKVLSTVQIRTVLKRLDAHEANVGHEFPGAFLWRFLAGTGLRVSEALGIDFYDPAKAETPNYANYIRLLPDGRYLVRIVGKARRLRDILLGDELGTAFAKRFPPGSVREGTPVFVTHIGRHTRLSRHGAHWEAKKIAAKFMMDLPNGMNRRHSLHALRHSLCTTLLCDLGADPIHVARLVGNTPEILSRVYLHRTKDLLKDFRLAS